MYLSLVIVRDPAHADDNQQRVYDEKVVSVWSIF